MFNIKKLKIQVFKMCLSISITCFIVSCKTISLQSYQTKTTQQITVGSIGTDKDFLLQQEFNSAAVPKYVEPIKLAVSIKPFTKQTFKNFTKAKALQSAKVKINYIDSIANKPKYIELQIADKVSIINAFNRKDNEDIKNYLSHNQNTNVVISISMALNENDLNNVTKANAVFLVEDIRKTYALQLYEANKKTGTIVFNDGIVFGYKTANCCWQENNKYQLNIVDLVTTFNSCPNNTYRYSKRAKKKINYYKL
ncbi:hypothetical protein Q4Q39_02660 [Flavivirga amylovorans]|uniref:Lipoprotein n=1 Tax=Flavivirga amylovorans TaxID=870486 RepID=A0ABT8WX83_9FLAO|nr:hypothetical protein [Flavivirga amylovorans]MDO5986295.1 hypothetical protein [Flavivirga amylovorans]